MASEEEGWTEVGKTGARPEIQQSDEPQQDNKETKENRFGQLGETDDPSTDIAAAEEDATGMAVDNAGENRPEIEEIVDEGSGFGAAGKDQDVKAPPAGTDEIMPEEYGAGDDEFVTRTNYPPSESVEEKPKKAPGSLKRRAEALEGDVGFGAAGKDENIKAPPAATDEISTDEYGAADDEFVTRSNYPADEPHSTFINAAKSFVAGVTGVGGGEDADPGTLVTLKNRLAGMDEAN